MSMNQEGPENHHQQASNPDLLLLQRRRVIGSHKREEQQQSPPLHHHAATISDNATKSTANGPSHCYNRQHVLRMSLIVVGVAAVALIKAFASSCVSIASSLADTGGASSFQEHLLQNFQQQPSLPLKQATTKGDVRQQDKLIEPQRVMQQATSRQGGDDMKKRSATKKHGDNNRPTFYLHVGLPKTGTTFLQCSLCQDASTTEPLLLDDNLVYLGTCPHTDCGIPNQDAKFLHHWPPAFFPHGSTKEANASPIGPIPHNDTSRVVQDGGADNQPLPKLAPTFIDRVNTARLGHHDALVIFEGCHVFSRRHIQALAEFLLPHWKVHILVAYRPLYEWLPSKYNSIHKPGRNRAGRIWPNMTDPEYPDHVGAPILPFDMENRGTFTDMVADIEHYQMHPAEMVRDNYRRFFHHVQILPLHQLTPSNKVKVVDVDKDSDGEADDDERNDHRDGGNVDPMLEYLFCGKALAKSTPTACQAVREGQLGATMPLNPSVALDYDLLAVAAHERKLFQVTDPTHPRTKRQRLVTMVQRHQEDTLGLSARDFAQTCLPDATLNRLEQLSLTLERRLFPVNLTTTAKAQEDAHHEGFLKEHSKYCWVNVDKVLQEQSWRHFFAARNTGIGLVEQSSSQD